MIMNIKYLYLLLAFALISCKKEACPADWTLFENDQFKICHPSEWETNTSGLYGSELVLIDMTNAAEIGFGRNVNIIKQHQSFFPQLNSLDDYATFSKEQMSDYLEEVQILLFTKHKIGTLDTYKSVMQANQMGRELFFVQYYFVHKEHYYVATYTTTNDDQSENKKLGEKIVESLELR